MSQRPVARRRIALAAKARFGLKGLFRILGQGCAILAITLALDYILLGTVFADWKRSWGDAATAYTQAYIHVPCASRPRHRTRTPCDRGDKILYPFRTDRYGFGYNGTCAPDDGDKSKPAIFVIGDSFTEGLGVPYEETFAGLMACEAAREGKAAWNLGVMSFSPIIYHLKIRAAAEKLGLKPAEIYVFLDLSDITDDAIVYRVGEDGTIRAAPSNHWFDTGQFLLGNFATFRLLYNLWIYFPFGSRHPMKAGAHAGASIPGSWTNGAAAGWSWRTRAVRQDRRYSVGSGSASSPWSSILGPTMSERAIATASRSLTGGSGRPSVAYASSMASPLSSRSRLTSRWASTSSLAMCTSRPAGATFDRW